MHYPFEILDAITSLLGDKNDLKSIRLVSKNFAVIGAAYLFNSVHISTRQEDLHAARKMFENFGQHIKTIVIVPAARVTNPSPFQRKTLQNRLRRLQGLKIFGDIKTHVDHIHEVHRNFCEEQKGLQRRVLQESELGPFLRPLLQLAPRFKKLCFSKTATKDIIAENLTVPCDQPQCTEIQRSYHERLIRNRKFSIHDLRSLLTVVLATLSQASVAIQYLEFQSVLANNRTYIDDFRTWQSPADTHRLLSGLTTLRLKVDPIYHTCLHGPHRFTAWLAIISPNIEKLWLEVPDCYNRYPYTQLELVLGSFRFPKLRTMYLQNFDSAGTELAALVQRCARLEELKINMHRLRTRDWGELYCKIISTTHLRPIRTVFRSGRVPYVNNSTPGIFVDFDRTLEAYLMIRTKSVVRSLWFWGKAEAPTCDTLDRFIEDGA